MGSLKMIAMIWHEAKRYGVSIITFTALYELLNILKLASVILILVDFCVDLLIWDLNQCELGMLVLFCLLYELCGCSQNDNQTDLCFDTPIHLDLLLHYCMSTLSSVSCSCCTAHIRLSGLPYSVNTMFIVWYIVQLDLHCLGKRTVYQDYA